MKARFGNLIDSHCVTAATFLCTGIQEAKLPSVKTFADNLFSRQGTVIKAYEAAQASLANRLPQVAAVCL